MRVRCRWSACTAVESGRVTLLWSSEWLESKRQEVPFRARSSTVARSVRALRPIHAPERASTSLSYQSRLQYMGDVNCL